MVEYSWIYFLLFFLHNKKQSYTIDKFYIFQSISLFQCVGHSLGAHSCILSRWFPLSGNQWNIKLSRQGTQWKHRDTRGMEWMYNVTNKWNGTIFDVSMHFTLYIALRHQKWYRFIYWWQALLNGYGHNPIVPDVLGSLIRIEKLNCNTRMDVSVRIQISTVLWHKRMKRKDLTLSLILKLAF